MSESSAKFKNKRKWLRPNRPSRLCAGETPCMGAWSLASKKILYRLLHCDPHWLSDVPSVWSAKPGSEFALELVVGHSLKG